MKVCIDTNELYDCLGMFYVLDGVETLCWHLLYIKKLHTLLVDDVAMRVINQVIQSRVTYVQCEI